MRNRHRARCLLAACAIPALLTATVGRAVAGQTPREPSHRTVIDKADLNRALIQAIKRDDTAAALAALHAGANANARDIYTLDGSKLTSINPIEIFGYIQVTLTRPTALLVALQSPHDSKALNAGWIGIRNEHLDLIRDLLEKGANPNARCANGDTALIRAASVGYLGTVRLLLDHGADADEAVKVAHPSGRMYILNEVYIGLDDGSCVGYDGAAPGPLCSEGDTPLMVASIHGRTEVVRLLLARGAHVNIRNEDGSTALMSAVEGWSMGVGSINGVKMLLDAGADIHVATRDGGTPLMIASSCVFPGEQADVVRLLLSRGAHIDARDARGITALMYAVVGISVNGVKVFLDAGADVHVRSKDGDTALSIITASNQYQNRHQRDEAVRIENMLKQAGAKE